MAKDPQAQINSEAHAIKNLTAIMKGSRLKSGVSDCTKALNVRATFKPTDSKKRVYDESSKSKTLLAYCIKLSTPLKLYLMVLQDF